MPQEHLLLIFVKNPELGKVKTRLAATVGDKRALRIYLQLLERTRTVTQPLDVDKTVYYSPEVQHDDLWDETQYGKARQREGDLGERMSRAFEEGFAQGYKRICIIGSDCYQLTTDILREAFETLATHDLVIGPSTDGGYYLLGMRQWHPELFRNKHWSTASVGKDTIAEAERKRLRWRELPTLSDVDEESDLKTMKGLTD